MSAREALARAEEEDLDLVKISPTAVPPVCKIMNYGKFKFEQAKKEKENRKNQKVVELKEIYLSMTIDIGDLNVKAKKTLEAQEKKLSNESFVSRAPAAVVEAERDRAEKAKALIANLTETLKGLK